MASSRIDQLKKQREQLDARIKAAEARERDKERKLETRRKIITGAIVREHAAKFPDSDFAKFIDKLLNEHVTREADRKALGLEPLPKKPNPRAPANQSNKPDTSATKASGVASIPWPKSSGG